MKINWKLRLQNKATLWSIVSLIVSVVYRVLNACGVMPMIGQNMVLEICADALTVLALLGVIVDPTTTGLSDSKRAMGYEQPWDDGVDWDFDDRKRIAQEQGGNG